MAQFDFGSLLDGGWSSRERHIALLAMLMVMPDTSDKYWVVSSPVMQALEPGEKALFGHWVEVWSALAEPQ